MMERIIRIGASTLVGLAFAQGVAWLFGLGALTTAIILTCIAYRTGFALVSEVAWPERS